VHNIALKSTPGSPPSHSPSGAVLYAPNVVHDGRSGRCSASRHTFALKGKLSGQRPPLPPSPSPGNLVPDAPTFAQPKYLASRRRSSFISVKRNNKGNKKTGICATTWTQWSAHNSSKQNTCTSVESASGVLLPTKRLFWSAKACRLRSPTTCAWRASKHNHMDWCVSVCWNLKVYGSIDSCGAKQPRSANVYFSEWN